MNCIIPFTKDIKFNSNIAEVSSISLEHDYTVNEGELLGNFTITGEYKSHEVSVNRESFEYVLPFSVSLTKPVDVNTVDFEIEDFTYEVIDDDTLKVDIEYQVRGEELEEREELFEEVEDDEEEIVDLIEDERDMKDEQIPVEVEIDEPFQVEVEKKEDIEEEKEMIMDSASMEEDTYITYHIHILKESETVESVCTMYNTSVEMLENYNDLTSLVAGDKLVIPDIDE